ncbi:DUF294 nucleotidyltransferase-like domain-containing protein [Pseudalkalibacillus decolorationis]|uniref:DUF294 nucleotidyltransferase-like domain-containing protein n=1 Tax=Pseudalkalibacillus decolorationis TaxID=163879 RepID=UPI002147654D|nr:DUF294 nucleotidyltransferase-like domain-containing protein [Pseudalkalibacillus decolorationis]
MSNLHESYLSLKNWCDNNIGNHQSSTGELNHFHDIVMRYLFEVALNKVKEESGPPPCQFSWFVMGSAGRFEQAVVSDQDHGLIYEATNKEASNYFRELGKEITSGLHFIGYPYCDGNVMSSNPLWCKSKQEWAVQLSQWMEDESFDSIRFLLIFYDARVLVGEEKCVSRLKQQLHEYIEKKPYFLNRLLVNTMHFKKAVGVFRQFLPETHGSHTGCIDLKHLGFFPFVNAIRLLSIKEHVEETSTLSRLGCLSGLPEYKKGLELYEGDFEKLLSHRLQHHQKVAEYYDDVHFLDVKKLGKTEKKEIKQILMNGKKLQEYTESIIKRTLKNEI